MSVSLYSQNCNDGLIGSYENVMSFSPSEPYFWDYMLVASSDADGNPLIVDFYLGGPTGKLMFTRTWTYDADGNVTSLTIS